MEHLEFALQRCRNRKLHIIICNAVHNVQLNGVLKLVVPNLKTNPNSFSANSKKEKKES